MNIKFNTMDHLIQVRISKYNHNRFKKKCVKNHKQISERIRELINEDINQGGIKEC